MKELIFFSVIVCFLFTACSNFKNTDDKFLGTWVFLNEIPKSAQRDNSMEGVTCKITKIENTDESYSVDFLRYEGIVFTIKNDSTLKAINADIQIKYIESDQHLIFEINPNDGIELYKLK